jgi:iron complex outermembrane receptor protein
MVSVRRSALASVLVMGFVSPSLVAQTASPGKALPSKLPEVVVTGNPLGSESFELAVPVAVIGGDELVRRRSSTLGETVTTLPGVNSTYFGPNASRPVIRGLDGDRVRILQNGAASLDASAASFDHAVAIDPIAVERIEVVRGPAALLYGGNAVGGVVNVLDNRIPQEAIDGVRGTFDARLATGGDRERATAALVEIGNGRFALHFDAHTRDTDDLKIPALARSQRLRDSGSGFGLPPSGTEAVGTLPNSAARASGGALGASITWERGYLGLSYTALDSRYGTVAEPEVVIDLDSKRLDLAGEASEIGALVRSVKFKFSHTDYTHAEIDAGVVATTFKNRGFDTRIEAVHHRIGPFTGAFGVQLGEFDFSALGAEAFLPATSTVTRGLFVFEELALGKLKLTLGARAERTRVSSEGGGTNDPATGSPRFDPPGTRAFVARSGALGAVYPLTGAITLAANYSSTERAPTFQELFANGPHAATGAYEIGSPAFGKEKSKALDVALRARDGPHSGSVGAFVNRFDRFLTLMPTGNNRGADGELNPVDLDGDGVADISGEEVLPEYVYRAVPATLRGFEAVARIRLSDRGGTLDLDLKADYVRAYDRATGQALPRIPPLRLRAGLAYRHSRFAANVEVLHARGQDRVAGAELPTDAYTLTNLAVSYRFGGDRSPFELFVRANNLFDKEARNHVSFLKDIAPLPGRNLLLGLRGKF